MRYFALMNETNQCVNILGTNSDSVTFCRSPEEWDTEITKEIFFSNPIGLYFSKGLFVPLEELSKEDSSGNNT